MCKQSPGLRCSHHAKIALIAINEICEQDPSDANLKKQSTAQYDYNCTPEGIALLKKDNHVDVGFFETVRAVHEKDYKEAVEARTLAKIKAEEAQEKHRAYLQSPAGIAELRMQGEDKLADKLEARIHGDQMDFLSAPKSIKDPRDTMDTSGLDSPTMASLVAIGILHGALAGVQSGKFSTALTSGVQAGRKHNAQMNNAINAKKREQSKILADFDREMERERLSRERGEAKWEKQVEAETKAYIRTHGSMHSK